VSGRSATRHVAGRYSGRDLAAQFNLSVPLGIPASPTLTSAVAMDEHGYARMQSGLTGRFGDGGELNYAASVAQGQSGGRQVGMALTRLFQGGEGTFSVEHAGGSRSTAASASGALVWHEGGITGTRRLGESMALLHAPGAAGARVTSSAGTRFDRRGFAVVPFLAPYRWNVIDVDPAGLSFDVTLETSRRRVAPTSGALVRVVFETDVGRTVLMTVKRAGGLAVPFGAEVADPEGRALGIVGQGGAVFVRGAQATVPLTVRWAGEHAGSCTLRMSEQAAVAEGLRRQTGICE
jgi:outer membrane usher protein